MIETEKLMKLVNFLRKGDFNGIKKFHFGSFTSLVREDEDNPGHVCGMSACACGMLPLVFDDIKYTFYNKIVSGIKQNDSNQNSFDGVTTKYFNITYDEFEALFTHTDRYLIKNLRDKAKIPTLSAYATAEEVAYNIAKYVKWRTSWLTRIKLFFNKKYVG